MVCEIFKLWITFDTQLKTALFPVNNVITKFVFYVRIFYGSAMKECETLTIIIRIFIYRISSLVWDIQGNKNTNKSTDNYFSYIFKQTKNEGAISSVK